MKLRYRIVNGILIVLGVAVVSLAIVLSHNADCPSAASVSGDSETMRAVRYHCYGSADVLALEDVAIPTPAGDKVLVRVAAAAVNPLDWHFMRGSPYFMRLMSGLGAPDDPGLGVDFAGTIEAVGSRVTRFKPGDEVFGGQNGSFAEYLTVGESSAVAIKPADVSFAQAASVPIAGVTALQALRDSGKLQPGQTVLINGASGGVGTFAVQIAKSFGAEVTGVCSTRNVEMVRSLGADYVVDYKKESYTEGDKKYDLILDMVGNHSLSANRRVLEADGKLVLVGGGKGNWIGPLLGPIKALLLSPFVDQEIVLILAELNTDDLTILGDMIQSGILTPVIDRRYALSDVARALEYSEEGHARGKIIIDVQQGATDAAGR